MMKKPVKIWCEVTCAGCGGLLAGGYYKRGIIAHMREKIREAGWTYDDEIGNLCEECRKEQGK